MLRSLLFRVGVAWRQSLWVLPALIVAGALLLAVVLVLVDPPITLLQELSPRLFTVSADGARGVLSSIATAMLSVAGVVFSITIATLSLTSQQFTSRVLRTFVRDRGNQTVLGVFLGAFVYCLIVLRAVRAPSDGPGYVPQLALLVAIGLAIAGAGFLIYFIDHVAATIQASAIIARVAADTRKALEDEQSETPAPELLRELSELPSGGTPVVASGSGYVRGVDLQAIGNVAARRDWRVRVLAPPGTFVVDGATLFEVDTSEDGSAAVGKEEVAALRSAVHLAASSDVDGDASFGIRQLVDIALKALSPGINDVTTALICLDHLGAVLLVAAAKSRPAALWRDEQGTARAVMRLPDFAQLLSEGLDQIREAGSSQMVVLLRELDVLEHLRDALEDDQGRSALVWGQADALERAARRGLSSPDEIRQVTAAAAALKESIGDAGREARQHS